MGKHTGDTIEKLFSSVERAEDHAKEVTAEQRAELFLRTDAEMDAEVEFWRQVRTLGVKVGRA